MFSYVLSVIMVFVNKYKEKIGMMRASIHKLRDEWSICLDDGCGGGVPILYN